MLPPVEPGQYTPAEFARYCTSVEVRPSIGRTGVCWDNAAAESFFATLKNEMYDRVQVRHPCPRPVRRRRHIEVFYNRTRLHSSLGYKTPAVALDEYQTHATTKAA